MTQHISLSAREAAKLLAVSRDQIAEWIRDGQLRTVDLGGRIRIPREEVERLAREGTRPVVHPARAPEPTKTGKEMAAALHAMKI